MNSKLMIWATFGLFLIISACSTAYRVDRLSSYLISKGNKFYYYSPRSQYYELDYDKSDSLVPDGLVYNKKEFEASTGNKVKFKYLKGDQFIYQIGKDDDLIISEKIGDTTINLSTFEQFFSFSFDYGNLCAIHRLGNHFRRNEYKHSFIKDTLVLTDTGLKECAIVHEALVEPQEIFVTYPMIYCIDKETGVPLTASYPYCSYEDSTSTYSIEYRLRRMERERKFFLLNKRRQLW